MRMRGFFRAERTLSERSLRDEVEVEVFVAVMEVKV
jgi:hypothetical protein